MYDIQKTLAILMEMYMGVREEIYNKMEAMLLKQSVLKETLPTLYPVDVPYQLIFIWMAYGSNYRKKGIP